MRLCVLRCVRTRVYVRVYICPRVRVCECLCVYECVCVRVLACMFVKTGTKFSLLGLVIDIVIIVITSTFIVKVKINCDSHTIIIQAMLLLQWCSNNFNSYRSTYKVSFHSKKRDLIWCLIIINNSVVFKKHCHYGFVIVQLNCI